MTEPRRLRLSFPGFDLDLDFFRPGEDGFGSFRPSITVSGGGVPGLISGGTGYLVARDLARLAELFGHILSCHEPNKLPCNPFVDLDLALEVTVIEIDQYGDGDGEANIQAFVALPSPPHQDSLKVGVRTGVPFSNIRQFIADLEAAAGKPF